MKATKKAYRPIYCLISMTIYVKFRQLCNQHYNQCKETQTTVERSFEIKSCNVTNATYNDIIIYYIFLIQ